MIEILLNVESKETRFAYLKHGVLHDLIVERKKTHGLAGNIYRGRVKNVLHNIQSAFIDIGEGENGFIHISDLVENIQKFQEMFDMDFDWDATPEQKMDRTKEADISKLLKPDQTVLVQVVKEPIGTKGARLTSNIAIAGRYLVLLPNTPHRGVSRKVEDPRARERLKTLIRAFEMPKDMGLICRTASAHATPEALIDEATELLHNWQTIIDKFKKANKPMCLFEESDLIKRAVLMAVDKRINRLLIDDYSTYQRCKRLGATYQSEYPLRIEFYRDKMPMFDRFNVEHEIERALKRKIWLHSGAYLFFEKTEAMYTVDVNSGRYSQKSTGDVEEALVHINLEAANEIARQLRIRNIGGLIICDFIDMKLRKNQKRVLEQLKDAMKEDSAKCTILNMSEFGLIEMTRQRSRESLVQTMFTECPYCNGSGMIKNHESTALEIERALKKLIALHQQYALEIALHPELERYLSIMDKDSLRKSAEKRNAHLQFRTDENLHINDFQFYSTLNGKLLEI